MSLKNKLQVQTHR